DELARHDGEISRLRAQLEIVESDRAALQAHYIACHSFLAPIRRVPAEILTEIFAYCRHHFSTDESLDDEEAKSRLVQGPLLTLARVCFYWYSITMGTPALW
ncbi:hypothetical protein B0H11DRAFT_1634368, partial [Mycena galericulata]